MGNNENDSNISKKESNIIKDNALNNKKPESKDTENKVKKEKKKFEISWETEAKKKAFIVFVLAFFLGFTGAHRFYVHRNITGVIYLFTVGLFLIGMFCDIMQIMMGTFKDGAGNKVEMI